MAPEPARRGRKPKGAGDASAPAPVATDTASAIASAMSLSFAFLAAMRPLGAWHRSPEDCRAVADSLNAAAGGVSPQVAELLAKVAPWLTLAWNGYALVQPSMERERIVRQAIAGGYTPMLRPDGGIDFAPPSIPGAAPAGTAGVDNPEPPAGGRIPNLGEVSNGPIL